MSPDLNIPSQFNSNDLMNFFTGKIDNIRYTITNEDSTASKPTTCLLDPLPTKLLKVLLPVAEESILNIINSSLSLGHVPIPLKLAVIKPLIKKPKLDPCELANHRPI